MSEETDPYDITALEQSLNASAIRVSTIWISFMTFSLYLLIAAATVTHRQILLASPIKLPVLNIDLPLWGFFFLAPILFVIFHAYVLLQVLLLGRTAAAYNDVVNRTVKSPLANAVLRQRLANTLFAQIFSGSPREREGWLGWLLRSMAWVTLAIAPLLILVVFQFSFLPYHSHLATWTHRALVLVELAAIISLWPLVLNAERDLHWHTLRRRIVQAGIIPLELFGSAEVRKRSLFKLRRLAFPLASSVFFVVTSFFVATFPGEPLVNLLTGAPWSHTGCARWVGQNFDRLILPRIDVVDDEVLAKFVRTSEEKQQSLFQGERTQSFRNRDLTCGDFSNADLRNVDFSGSILTGATFDGSEMQGATLNNAKIDTASLVSVKLNGASLTQVDAQGADFESATLDHASLNNAQFQRASLVGAQLKGAVIYDSQFQFAKLEYASLQGALFQRSNLIGTELENARLLGASLSDAKLQGANMRRADLSAADLSGAQLQGAILDESKLTMTVFDHTFLWRTAGAQCQEAQVKNPDISPIIVAERKFEADSESPTYKLTQATPDSVRNFIDKQLGTISIESRKTYRATLSSRLARENSPDDTRNEEEWKNCAKNALSPNDYYKRLARFLVTYACAHSWNDYFGVNDIIEMQKYAEMNGAPRSYTDELMRGLLGSDKTWCKANISLSEKLRKDLREMLSRPIQE